MIKLSIIIPVYNVERYVAQCLDSVFNQDIPEDEYEVICVNDGSTDRSRDIVASYLPKHSNLRLIDHPYNKKLGAARNTGRAVARGKYIWNVDSDDMIETNCLKKLTSVCEEADLDILLFNYKCLYQERGELESVLFVNCDTPIMGGLQFVEKIASKSIASFCPVWRQIYKREFLCKNHISSPPINMGEDVPFSFEALLKAERLQMITEMSYIYRSNSGSLTGVYRKLEPNVLYEKCIVCSKLIYNVARMVPKGYENIFSMFCSVSRFTFDECKRYMVLYNQEEKRCFASICRKRFLQNIQLLNNMSNKSILYYFSILL